MPVVARRSIVFGPRRACGPHVAFPERAAPTVLPAAGTTARLYALISIATSFFGHTAVLAALALAGGRARVVWVSVERGPASIELQASMAATASRGDEQPLDPVVLEQALPTPRKPEPPVLLAAADASVTPITRHASQPAMPRMEPPVEMAQLVVRAPLAPALEDRVLHDQNAPSDKPDQAVQSAPQPPRSAVGRRLAEGLVPSTAQSAPSPASVASRGAQTDLPAIVSNPAPEYPIDALNARLSGRVLVRVVVGADGAVLHAALHEASGVASLDDAALRAVRTWRFSASASGAAERELIVPIRFRIEDAP